MKLDITNTVPAGAIFAMADSVEDMRKRIDALATEAEGIKALAATEDRDLSEDELDAIVALAADADKLTRQITAQEAFAPKGQGRRSAPEPRGTTATNTVPAQAKNDDGKFGFKSLGEFAMTVRKHGMEDGRLRAVATTFGNEGTGADGGFAVPTEWSKELFVKDKGNDDLMARCAQLQISGNSIVLPKDEDMSYSTSGIRAYWEGEADAVTASKPALEADSKRLNKLMALVPMTEELLEDAAGMESWLRLKAPAKMRSKVNTAIVDGTGAGQPLGLLNSPSAISIAKESGQAADTVVFNNISNMWARLYAPFRANAVWLINQDVEPQLDRMFVATGTTGQPVYIPSGGLSASPYATLKGRPVIPVDACKTVGDVGDIILTDLTQYMMLTKAGQDVQTDVSMHLYFDQGLQAFRFTFRVTGAPMWRTAITPENGSNTLSSIVTLAAR